MSTSALASRPFGGLFLPAKRRSSGSGTSVRIDAASTLAGARGDVGRSLTAPSLFANATVYLSTVAATEKAAAAAESQLAEKSRQKLRRLALQKQQEELGLQPLAELHEPTHDMLVGRRGTLGKRRGATVTKVCSPPQPSLPPCSMCITCTSG